MFPWIKHLDAKKSKTKEHTVLETERGELKFLEGVRTATVIAS